VPERGVAWRIPAWRSGVAYTGVAWRSGAVSIFLAEAALRSMYSRKRKGLFYSTTSDNHILYYSFPLMCCCTNGMARRSVQYHHSV